MHSEMLQNIEYFVKEFLNEIRGIDSTFELSYLSEFGRKIFRDGVFESC